MINNTNALGGAVFAPIAAGAGDRLALVKFDLVHHVPGRLRLRSASLRGDGRGSERARHDLASVEGVISVAANPCTGSLLVEYDIAVLRPDKIIDVLTSRGYNAATAEERDEPGAGWAERLAGAVKDWMIGAVADRLALALIAALA
jgi:hypothetical protein